ncbi:calmodulin-regulated spectrin-associated protein 3 isoform X1 [Solea senegalensis]|uniref:Calmodulin-regulated spectrin-associated protein 3 isoform X1 n=1 Tax=Solea senegalensis TaxID=28829 RepID=A0AAV6PN20_SOLSE|nr:calmodulin-regulated spectrin-associated protein 3 isoform X2 [Solea senegalensis]KAG7471564.1 calmodulin-regulated spectrin-associated protein 3 isoform X1 [Solea senegalensis]
MVDSPTMRKTFVVPDAKPLDLYDCTKAKICASVGWLLAKSYGTAENVPAELRDPFYCDQYEQEHLKPPVTRLLQSSELYCRTYSLLRRGTEAESEPKDNVSLLELLTKKCLLKDKDTLVTDADLRHKPIKMSAHLVVIDALMAVGAMETVTAVKTCGSAELLGRSTRWEEALLHWVNELNQKLRELTEGSQNDSSQATEPQPLQPSLRYRKDKIQSKQKAIFPLVNEVKDLSSGCAVAAVIHYYCPGLLRLEDVCMKDSISVADSLYNLQFIREFCDSCLKCCCHMTLEDMLYTPQELELNWLSFLAELLSWFELQRPDFVQPVDTLDGSAPVTPSGNSSSPSIFKKPFLPISSPALGSLTQSTSMSHIEGVGKTWSKKSLSRPLSAVSFSIPFGLDSDVDIVMGNPVITRSVSSDQLNPAAQNITRVPYTPPEDISNLLNKPLGPNGPQRASWATQTPNIPRLEDQNSLLGNETGELPTIEEALQIIHNENKMEPRLHPDGAPDGFYLHSPDDPASSRHTNNLAPISSSAPTHSGMMHRPTGEPRQPTRTRNTSECSRDDDSVLRDGSVDSDASEDMPKAQSTPATPAASAYSVRSHGKEESDSGVKLTSFAERKKKQIMDSPKAKEPSSLQVTTWAKKSEESPSKSPQLNNEMSELGTRLEEKRKAIEAQKKRIEAIFAKHRQRLGKSAFLQLKKEQDEGEGEGGNGKDSTSSTEEDLSRLTLEERLARMEAEVQQDQDEQHPSVKDEGHVKGGLLLNKQFSYSKEKTGTPGDKDSGTPEKTVAPLGDYNNAVSKLTAALSSLQSDMQRLTEQQNHLIKKKPTSSNNKSWVITPSPKTSTPAPPRMSRESNRNLNSASSSPSPSRRITNYSTPPKSPQVHRRTQSVPPKSPKHHQNSRPPDIRVTTLSRVLTPPQNVDRIPHLRRVNPRQSQVQTSSSFSIGDSGSLDDLRSPGPTPTPTPTLTPIPTPTPTPHPIVDDSLSEVGSIDDQSIFSMDLETASLLSHATKRDGVAGGGCSSGAPSECSFESDAPAGMLNGKRSSLIEISLSALEDGQDDDHLPDSFLDSMSDKTEPELKGGLGFFFKDDKERPEDEMAQRRAALLEKQQKRADEMKRRKLEQEKAKESNKPQWMTIEGWGNKSEDRPQTPGTPPTSSTPPVEGTPHRRGDFTRQEYERRQQLKIMEDLDKVLRQKPTTVRGVKKQRPKTVFRDDSGLSHSPAKGFMGTKLNKVYSHSSMNLSSMANDSGGLSVRKSPSRSHSPSRQRSPGRSIALNGEKDWENGSTISSPASIPEYTGPKLYKEPSFKSNKFIIHNAITRCCLAGKVNEPQKNKIVEEMEKCAANHFLILFRDASCQFRAVYTMNLETEEMERLTGIGPRIISPEMVESIYKYSSDRKQFTAIPSKTMSMSVDAFTIPGHFWQKRPGTPKKLGTPK